MKIEKKTDDEQKAIEQLLDKVTELSANMERMRLAEYVEMFEKPLTLLYVNFLIGLARGFGTAIGFTILAALVIYFCKRLFY